MTKNHPRLLVASEFPPNAGGGGPAVVRQMLKGWPAEKLFWWSCLPESDQRFDRQVAGHAVATIPPRLWPHQRWCAQKSWLLETFWVPWASRHFTRTLALFKPDVAWIIPHNWSIPPLARALSAAGLPCHVSMHDYPDVHVQVSRLGAGRSRHFAEQADRLYAQAATRDAICQPMVEDLQARTNAAGSVNHAGLEPEDLAYLSAKTTLPDGPIRIAYPGTIIVEREFVLLAKVLAELRPQLPRPVTLEFFGGHSYRSRPWFDPAWMVERGNLSAAELLVELRKCTWGLVPMGLTDDDPRYNQFSLPTKFVSYLQAGLPIIALGHPQSSVMQTIKEFRPGVIRTDGDLDGLRRDLLAALSLPDPWAEFGPDLVRCARSGFDAQQMREILWGQLQKAGN